LSETFLVIRRNRRDFIKKLCRSSCKALLILDRFLIKLELFRRVLEKIPQVSNFIEVRPFGAELFHEDKQIQKDRQAQKWQVLFAFLQRSLKTAAFVSVHMALLILRLAAGRFSLYKVAFPVCRLLVSDSIPELEVNTCV